MYVCVHHGCVCVCPDECESARVSVFVCMCVWSLLVFISVEEKP